MKAQLIIIMTWLLSIFGAEYGWATMNEPLQFGVFQTTSNTRSVEKFVSREFSAEDALFLASENNTFVLYNKGGMTSFLSEFTQGQEQMLWKTTDIVNLTTVLVPKPVLATGHVDNNQEADVILCYSIDLGVSPHAERWEQYMLVFLDGQQKITPSLLLSKMDEAHGDTNVPDSEYFEIGSDGQPASRRETLVLLFPANGTEPCTFILWSRLETYDYPPTNTPHSILYTIDTYQLDSVQFINTKTETGTSVSTAQTLRTLVEAERAAGTPPILLDFNQRPTDYLVSDDDWFAWERIGD